MAGVIFVLNVPAYIVHRMALSFLAVKNYIVWDMGIPSNQ